MTEDKCKGCKDNEYEECWIKLTNGCPCQICLVKTMCYTPCISFHKFEEDNTFRKTFQTSYKYNEESI